MKKRTELVYEHPSLDACPLGNDMALCQASVGDSQVGVSVENYTTKKYDGIWD